MKKTRTISNYMQETESDKGEFLSELLDDITLGTPIGFLINNNDARSSDYESTKSVYRPSHGCI